MWNKIKRVLLNNIWLKLLAIVFAIGLWFVVVNVNDPNQTKSFTTNVNIINGETITSQGKYYKVVSDKSVTFRVTAKRSVIEKLNNNDFSAIADMNLLDDDKVPIEIYPNKYENQIDMSSKVNYLEVSIGKAKSNQFTVVAKTSGEPGAGYAVEDAKCDTKTVTVYGPEDVISSITSAEAILPVDGATGDTFGEVAITLIDKNGNQVDTSELNISKEKVGVTATICSVKIVPIKVETSGSLPEGLSLGEIKTDPNMIYIKGDSKALNKVSEVTIPSSVVNLSNVTADFETTVDISSYLPSDVSVLNPQQSMVVLKVYLNNKMSKNVKVQTSNLTIKNLQSSVKGQFIDSVVNVEVVALPEYLDRLNDDNITGYVDASGLSRGTHLVTVNLNLDSEYTSKMATTKIKIE